MDGSDSESLLENASSDVLTEDTSCSGCVPSSTISSVSLPRLSQPPPSKAFGVPPQKCSHWPHLTLRTTWSVFPFPASYFGLKHRTAWHLLGSACDPWSILPSLPSHGARACSPPGSILFLPAASYRDCQFQSPQF